MKGFFIDLHLVLSGVMDKGELTPTNLKTPGFAVTSTDKALNLSFKEVLVSSAAPELLAGVVCS